MRRLLILIALFLSVSALPVCAEEGGLFSASFESLDEFSAWDGGVRRSISTDGKYSCSVNNPYGEEVGGLVSHILFRIEPIALSSGEIYRLSFDAMAPDVAPISEVKSEAYFGEAVKNIAFEVDGVGDEWTEVNMFFMVPQDAEYRFSVELKNVALDGGFLIDNLSITSIDLAPVNLMISGPEELSIPVMGEQSTRYGVGGQTADGEVISVLSDVAILSADGLPAGVSFDDATGTVTVSDACPSGASFTLTCAPPDYLSLQPVSMRVTLSSNILINSDFSSGGDHWESDGGFDLGSGIVGNYITLFTDYFGPYGYYAELRPDRPIMLVEGNMYVFRALVKVESGSNSSAYSQNTVFSQDGEVAVNIIDISAGDWTEVFAAFTPEFTGVYNLSLKFTTSEPGGVVSVSNMSLAPEPPEETFVTLHAPGNISIPDTVTEYPLNAYVRDQSGAVLGDRCYLSLYPDDSGITLSSSGITVSPNATAGEYEIYAVSVTDPSLAASINITVSYDNVADGGFEEYGTNYRWAAASPAALRIDENIDGHFARVTSDAEFAVVINNSYMHLYADTPYAFRADTVGGKASVVTAFIETVDGEMIPVVQSGGENGGIFELFQTDTDVIGRLMLHIAAEDGGDIDFRFDNVELFRSIVSVSAPRVRGLAESGAELTAEFDFFNNMDSANDSSACVISWYGMSAAGGEPVYVGSGETFAVLPELVGRYVFFEVTPVCAITGLSGIPARSVPLAIGSLREDDGGFDLEPVTDSHPLPPQESAFSPVKLPEQGQASAPFGDVKGHWAEKYVAPLFAAGVVSGRDENSFRPDDKITRAEFAAMLCRAFGASGGEAAFADVPSDAWYASAVGALASAGIVNGTSANEFSPEKQVTREEMAVMLMRLFAALGGESGEASLNVFYDKDSIDDWAKSSVAAGLKIGLVNGTEQSTFAPVRAATRGEACAMICRLLDKLDMEENEE